MANKGNFIVCCVLVLLAQSGSAMSDRPGCNKLLCPPLKEIQCPEDSLRVIYHPPNENNQITEMSTNPNDYLKKESSEKTITTLPSNMNNAINEMIDDLMTVNHSKRSLPESDLKNLNDDCCPFSICTCKEVCDIPSCHNSSLVLVEIKAGALNVPGECCAEYECTHEPNCTEVHTSHGPWLIDCQKCQCLSGQKICHRSCDEIRQPPANCLSQSLKRSFFNGDTWKEDECTQCACLNGEKNCQTSFCRALSCPNKIKLPGECCPICASEIPPPDVAKVAEITSIKHESITTELPCRTTESPSISVYTENIGLVEPTKQNCILYGIIAALAIMATVFLALYLHERSKQRSYRPVPIFDSNFNKIKSIVTA